MHNVPWVDRIGMIQREPCDHIQKTGRQKTMQLHQMQQVYSFYLRARDLRSVWRRRRRPPLLLA
jgi:hypothetical protein